MNNAFVLCLTVGITWAAAPFLARISALNPWVMTTLIGTGTMVPLIPLFFNQDFTGPGGKAIALGLLGGVLNGIGLLAWYSLVAGSNEGKWELGGVLPIAIVLLSVAIVIGGRVFFQETITMERVIGLALACGAVYFLR